jgi:RNA polymerase sigma factor (sigma-70 family)
LAVFLIRRLYSGELMTANTHELVADYIRNGSEAAFRELVTRYLDLVYSTAVRLVDGDTHRAEDVAQTVFVDLACMAGKLSKNTVLGGWLHRHTCFVAATLMRGERRRQARERESVEMNAVNDNNEAGLAHIAPMLDAAINQLGDEDRAAIMLRFFERHDLRSVGEAMGSSENAAQKRVGRALVEMRAFLEHRGVTFSATALGAALTTEAVTAAPAGLAAGIAATALASASAGSGVTLTLLKFMTMTKLKLGIVSAILAAGLGVSLWLHQKSEAGRGGGGPKDPENEMLWKKSLFATVWGHALLKFAEKNDEQMPSSLAAAAPYLKDNERLPSNWRNTDQIIAAAAKYGIRIDQFELVYRGSLTNVQDPSRTILMREKEPYHAKDGRWKRVYVFANGLGGVEWTDDGDFERSEREGRIPYTPKP